MTENDSYHPWSAVPSGLEDGGVPDHFDYEWLDEFTGEAPNWSAEDVATAASLLTDQRRALDDTHPRDKKTRKRLQQVVKNLELAIEKATG